MNSPKITPEGGWPPRLYGPHVISATHWAASSVKSGKELHEWISLEEHEALIRQARAEAHQIIAELAEALEFYAEPTNWSADTWGVFNIFHEDMGKIGPANTIAGKRARETLATLQAFLGQGSGGGKEDG
jgi:hypothetical protein